MQFVDFFSGVGGIRLGLEQAGHECVGGRDLVWRRNATWEWSSVQQMRILCALLRGDVEVVKE